jgi:hypothetical protein
MKTSSILLFILIPLKMVYASSPTEFPATLEIQGQEYKYDQNKLQESLVYLSDQLIGLSNSTNPNSASSIQQEVIVLRSNMALALLSAKYFAVPTPELINLLKRIERDLANVPLPDGLLLPEDMLKGIAAVSFINKDGQVPDINTVTLSPGRFAMLAAKVRMDVEARSLKTIKNPPR